MPPALTRPSFAALFRQSRYARDDKEHTQTKQNRRELFSVAAVGFVMQHDKAFRNHFLRTICGVPETQLNDEFEIELQAEHHADLRIQNKRAGAVYIVEFKVDARLAEKQDCLDRNHFLKEGSGYGWQLQQAYPQRAHLSYTIIEKFAVIRDDQLDGIHVHSRSWKDLVHEPSQESSLVADLFDSLGANIPSLRFRKHKAMTKAPQTRHAADMFQILTATATTDLGMRQRDLVFDAQVDDVDGSFYGLNVPHDLKLLAHLEQFGGSRDDALGWFGYSIDGQGRSSIDIWFYCPVDRAAAALVAVTPFLPSDALAMIHEGCVRITAKGDSVDDDRTWFARVFDALRRKSDPLPSANSGSPAGSRSNPRIRRIP